MTESGDMNHQLPKRITYYTKKVAQFGAIHPSKPQPRAFKYRHQRLMNYKKRMHELIKEERANRRGLSVNGCE